MTELVGDRAEYEALLEQGEIAPEEWAPVSPDVLLERETWTLELAQRFFPAIRYKRRFAYDSVLGWRRAGGLKLKCPWAEHPAGGFFMETNALGLRDGEIREEWCVRVLVAGDSQTEGVCGNRESFVNLLEGKLDPSCPSGGIDVINAALGGSEPWYYLTTLEAYKRLEPDVFVAVFYGGNDFREALRLERYYRGRPPGAVPSLARLTRGLEELPVGLGPVELSQASFLLDNPDDGAVAVQTWTALAMEMSRQCAAAGIEFLPVYLPPPLAGQPDPYAVERSEVARVLPEVGAGLDLTSELADAWIAQLTAEGVHVFDLRPAIAVESQRLFWAKGWHLNLTGHEVVARALEAELHERVGALCEAAHHAAPASR
jgi:lysophospholipase L1-like esterase